MTIIRECVCPDATVLSAVPGGPGVTDLHPTAVQTGVHLKKSVASARKSQHQMVKGARFRTGSSQLGHFEVK